MELNQNKLYRVKDLFDYLKSKGISISKPTLLRYEKDGIIPSPKSNVESSYKKPWRIYTAADMVEIEQRLRNYLTGKQQ